MPHMTDDEVFQEYQARFIEPAIPPLDYGHHNIPERELAKLARVALDAGRPIPWDELLAPLPPGAVS